MGIILFRIRLPAGGPDDAPVLSWLVDRIEIRTGAVARRTLSADGRSLSATLPGLHDQLDAGPAPEDDLWDVELGIGTNPYFEYNVRRAIEDIGGKIVPLRGGPSRNVERIERWERPWQELPLGERLRYGSLRAPLNLLGLVFVAIPLELGRAVRSAVRPSR